VLRTHPLGCACPRCNPASTPARSAEASAPGSSRHASAVGAGTEPVYKIPRHPPLPSSAGTDDAGHPASPEPEAAPRVEMPTEAPPPLPSAPRLDVRA
jgi:hypothetical protein